VAGIQAAGTVTGLLTLVAASPWLGAGGSALGVLVGSAVNGLVPMGVVWRREGMRWGGLALRASAGTALLAAAVLWLAATDASFVVVLAVTAGWLAAWAAISWPETRRLLPGATPAPAHQEAGG
jgi:hypothetical protein